MCQTPKTLQDTKRSVTIRLTVPKINRKPVFDSSQLYALQLYIISNDWGVINFTKRFQNMYGLRSLNKLSRRDTPHSQRKWWDLHTFSVKMILYWIRSSNSKNVKVVIAREHSIFICIAYYRSIVGFVEMWSHQYKHWSEEVWWISIIFNDCKWSTFLNDS